MNTLENNITPRKSYFMGWLIWSIASSFVLFQFFLQLSSGAIVGSLMQSFHISAFGAGLLASTYYYVYVSLQAPSGLLIDRYGPRSLLAAGALVCAFGTFLFGYADSVWISALGRVLMGTGAACAFVGSLNLIARWFPPERFAFMAAVAEAVGMMGTIIGSTALAMLLSHYGWRECMMGASVLAVLISILIAVFVRNAPPAAAPMENTLRRGRFWQDIMHLAKNKVAWINGIYSGLMFSIVTVFLALWGVPFLMRAHNLNLVHSMLCCNLVFLGVAIGGPIIGWLDGCFRARRAILVSCALASGVLTMLIIYVTALPIFLLSLVMVLLGMTVSTYVLSFAVANEIVPNYLRGTSMGFTNMLSVCTAPIMQPLVGLLLSLMAKHDITQHGLHNYSLWDYQVALSILPLACFIAGFLALLIPGKRIS